jgi:hypothetical protein
MINILGNMEKYLVDLGDGKYMTIPCDGIIVIGLCTVIRVDKWAAMEHALKEIPDIRDQAYFKSLVKAVVIATRSPRNT